MPPPSLLKGRAKVAEFYSASCGTIPPLPWQTFPPPFSQEQLAELSGFSQQYISGLEQGRRNPTVVSLYELATALGVSHMELVRSAEDE